MSSPPDQREKSDPRRCRDFFNVMQPQVQDLGSELKWSLSQPLIRYSLVHGERYPLFSLVDLGLGSSSSADDALTSRWDQNYDGMEKCV